jgi:hypothetical protein
MNPLIPLLRHGSAETASFQVKGYCDPNREVLSSKCSCEGSRSISPFYQDVLGMELISGMLFCHTFLLKKEWFNSGQKANSVISRCRLAFDHSGGQQVITEKQANTTNLDCTFRPSRLRTISIDALCALGVLELTHNHVTEADPNFKGYASGYADPGRGFGHIV